jgi:hypothetical protein
MNRLIKAEEDPTFSKKKVALLPYIERIREEIKRQQDGQCLEKVSTVLRKSFISCNWKKKFISNE